MLNAGSSPMLGGTRRLEEEYEVKYGVEGLEQGLQEDFHVKYKVEGLEEGHWKEVSYLDAFLLDSILV